MKENSDHYSFFTHNIPVLMFHTGLHDDYHRPSDDAHKVNAEGMQQAARLLFEIAHDLAERPATGEFRGAARYETPAHAKRLEAPLPPSQPRMGIWMETASNGKAGVVLTQMQRESPAERAGLRTGDRIIQFDGRRVASRQELVSAILKAGRFAEVIAHRADTDEPVTCDVALNGRPVRLGISWREDQAEPGSAILTRITPGSPAELSGMKVGDRIYAVGGRDFRNSSEMLQLLTTLQSPLSLLVERQGKLRTIKVDVPPPADNVASGR
jgi:S1-C subfamily serine protease